MIGKMNKRAEEEYLSVWNFLIFIVVGLAIFTGIYLFENAHIDVKQEEAKILSLKLLDCISSQGKMVDVLDSNFDIYSKCSLESSSFEAGGVFAFKIEIKDSSKNLKTIVGGDQSLVDTLCKIRKNEKTFPECYGVSGYRVGKVEGVEKNLFVNIVSASNNQGAKP